MKSSTLKMSESELANIACTAEGGYARPETTLDLIAEVRTLRGALERIAAGVPLSSWRQTAEFFQSEAEQALGRPRRDGRVY